MQPNQESATNSRVGFLPAKLHQSIAAALAAWLVVVILWPQPKSEFRASTVVLPSIAVDEAVLATYWRGEAIETWLASESDKLASGMRLADGQLRAHALSTAPTTPIELQLQAGSRQQANALLAQLAPRLAADYLKQHAIEQQNKIVQSQLAAVRSLRLEEDRLRRQLAEVVDAAIDEARQNTASTRPEQPNMENPSTAAAPDVDDPLEIRLAQLRLELVELEGKFTAEHPSVISVIEQIRQIESQLGTQPRGTPGTLDFSSNAAATDFVSTSVSYPSTGIGPVTVSEESRHLESEIAAVSDRRQQSEWRLEELVRSKEAVAAQLEGQIATPVEVVRTSAPLSIGALLTATISAMLLGYFTLRLTSLAARPTILASGDDVTRLLGVPMIGSTTSSPISAQALQIRRAKLVLPWIVGCSETVIAAVLLASLTAAILDPILSREFLSNPLAGMLELSSRMLGR